MVEQVTDPTVRTPSHVLHWDGQRWLLTNQDSRTVLMIGPTLDVNKLQTALQSARPRLFVQMPPTNEVAENLRNAFSRRDSPIQIVTNKNEDPLYYLIGRAVHEDIQYAWVLPNVVRDGHEDEILPAATKWISMYRYQALGDLALRLRRVKAWHELDAPRGVSFPYRLSLKSPATGVALSPRQVVRQGEKYDVFLSKDPDVSEISPRFVYIFSIDSFGRSQLLFPNKFQGTVENRLPDAGLKAPNQIELAKFKVGPPFGLDTYVLLTTSEPLSDTDVLNFEGVGGKGGRPEGTPLTRVLRDVQEGSRGTESIPMPTDWSISRLIIRSQE